MPAGPVMTDRAASHDEAPGQAQHATHAADDTADRPADDTAHDAADRTRGAFAACRTRPGTAHDALGVGGGREDREEGEGGHDHDRSVHGRSPGRTWVGRHRGAPMSAGNARTFPKVRTVAVEALT